MIDCATLAAFLFTAYIVFYTVTGLRDDLQQAADLLTCEDPSTAG